ncbi:hypothetical protein Tco_0410397 [Tanacetum coccineum]
MCGRTCNSGLKAINKVKLERPNWLQPIITSKKDYDDDCDGTFDKKSWKAKTIWVKGLSSVSSTIGHGRTRKCENRVTLYAARITKMIADIEGSSHGPSDANAHPSQATQNLSKDFFSFLSEIKQLSIVFLTAELVDFDKGKLNFYKPSPTNRRRTFSTVKCLKGWQPYRLALITVIIADFVRTDQQLPNGGITLVMDVGSFSDKSIVILFPLPLRYLRLYQQSRWSLVLSLDLSTRQTLANIGGLSAFILGTNMLLYVLLHSSRNTWHDRILSICGTVHDHSPIRTFTKDLQSAYLNISPLMFSGFRASV